MIANRSYLILGETRSKKACELCPNIDVAMILYGIGRLWNKDAAMINPNKINMNSYPALTPNSSHRA